MIDWEQESFSDLSGTWLQAYCGEMTLCIEHEAGVYYSVTLDYGSELEDMATVRGVYGLDEAKAIGESLALQWMLDRYYPILEALGVFDA